MKFVKLKLISILTGISLLAASLAPAQTNALGMATISLSGASNTTGIFSVMVYEDTGSETVVGAHLEMNFSKPVSNVSYDYSVGPFTAVTPSGKHNALGPVSGKNPLARVSFKLDTPGTVTASVSSSSYLKHVDGTTVEDFPLSLGSAEFTYVSPSAPPSNGGNSNPGGSNQPAPAASTNTPAIAASNNRKPANNSNSQEQDQNQIAGDNTTTPTDTTTTDDTGGQATSSSNDENQSAGSKNWLLWPPVIAIALGAAFYIGRLQAVKSMSKATTVTKKSHTAKPKKQTKTTK